MFGFFPASPFLIIRSNILLSINRFLSGCREFRDPLLPRIKTKNSHSQIGFVLIYVCGVRGSCTIERVEYFTANLKKMSWNKSSLSRKNKIEGFGVRNWLLEDSFESL